MSKMISNTAAAIVLLAVGLIFILAIQWYITQQFVDVPAPVFIESSSRPTPSTELDTSGWVEYRNEELGFTVYHPRELAVIDGSEIYIEGQCFIKEERLERLNMERLGQLEYPDVSEPCTYTFTRRELDGLDVEEWVENDWGESSYREYTETYDGTWEWRQLGGRDWLIVGADEGLVPTTYLFTEIPGDAVIRVEKRFRHDDAEIYAILSTFEFIESKEIAAKIDTSDWIEYRNNGFGVRFAYPSTFELVPELEPDIDCSDCEISVELKSPSGTSFFFTSLGRGLVCASGKTISYVTEIDDDGSLRVIGKEEIVYDVSICPSDVSSVTIIFTSGRHHGESWSFGTFSAFSVEEDSALFVGILSTFEFIE